jgi:hypothetical protein
LTCALLKFLLVPGEDCAASVLHAARVADMGGAVTFLSLGHNRSADVEDALLEAMRQVREREREREDLVGSHTGGGNALAFKQPTCPYDIERGPGGRTREVETPSPSNRPVRC